MEASGRFETIFLDRTDSAHSVALLLTSLTFPPFPSACCESQVLNARTTGTLWYLQRRRSRIMSDYGGT